MLPPRLITAVVDVMIPYFLEQYGNPSSIHKFADGVARGLKHSPPTGSGADRL